LFVFAVGVCFVHSFLEHLLHRSSNARDANYTLTIFGQRKVVELVGISRGLGVRPAAADTCPKQLGKPVLLPLCKSDARL
jgi:hypothetical protein